MSDDTSTPQIVLTHPTLKYNYEKFKLFLIISSEEEILRINQLNLHCYLNLWHKNTYFG